METQTLIRLVVGLLMTAVVLVFAAKRVLWLTKPDPVGSAHPRRGRPQGQHLRRASPRSSKRSSGRPGCSAGPSPASPTSSPCGASSSSPASTSRPTACCSTRSSPSRSSGTGTRSASCRTSSPLAVLLGIATFAIIRLRSRAQGVRPRLAVLRLAHRRRLADPVHDLQRHLDLRAVPRRRRRHRQPALRLGRLLLARHGRGAGAAGPSRQRVRSRPSRCCCTSASCWSSC